MTNPNLVVKYSLIDTFRSMKPGQTITVKEKVFKWTSARSAKYILRKEGIEVSISNRGMVGEWTATRLK